MNYPATIHPRRMRRALRRRPSPIDRARAALARLALRVADALAPRPTPSPDLWND